MKARNIGILLWYTALFQIVLIISSKLPSYEERSRKIYKAYRNWIDPTELKVNISINSRELRNTMDTALPIRVDELDRWCHKRMLNFRKKLVFIIHGFLSDGKEKWTGQLSSVYIRRKDAVVFIVDWGTGAITANYNDAVKKTLMVAKELVRFIELLIERASARASSIHIIGHNLGAHIAAFVGKTIPNITRITGLDPAYPGFPHISQRLCKGDAKNVDIVHTSGILGNAEILGDVDFYVNEGQNQPGCTPTVQIDDFFDSYWLDRCAHGMAINYFIESINNTECRFVASNTIERARNVRSTDLDPHTDTVLGLNTFKCKGRGEFFLITNSDSPYCRH